MFAQRDSHGRIVALFANPQPGYAEEEVADAAAIDPSASTVIDTPTPGAVVTVDGYGSIPTWGTPDENGILAVLASEASQRLLEADDFIKKANFEESKAAQQNEVAATARAKVAALEASAAEPADSTASEALDEAALVAKAKALEEGRKAKAEQITAESAKAAAADLAAREHALKAYQFRSAAEAHLTRTADYTDARYLIHALTPAQIIDFAQAAAIANGA